MSQTNTMAPAALNARAIASPMPEAPAVIRTRCVIGSPIFAVSLDRGASHFQHERAVDCAGARLSGLVAEGLMRRKVTGLPSPHRLCWRLAAGRARSSQEAARHPSLARLRLSAGLSSAEVVERERRRTTGRTAHSSTARPGRDFIAGAGTAAASAPATPRRRSARCGIAAADGCRLTLPISASQHRTRDARPTMIGPRIHPAKARIG